MQLEHAFAAQALTCFDCDVLYAAVAVSGLVASASSVDECQRGRAAAAAAGIPTGPV